MDQHGGLVQVSMPKSKLPMRKIREILRLKFELKRKHREIAAACCISPGTVSDLVGRWHERGLEWPTELSDHQLDAIMYPPPERRSDEPAPVVPDWEYVHRELRTPDCHMTLNLLWKEYKAAHPKAHYGRSWFCRSYREWAGRLDPVMRQVYKYGEKCFIDFTGDTLSVLDPDTNEIRQAQVFVATLGASNYTYCDVCWSQDLPTWLRLHVDMFHFFGGCPAVLVPDNLKAGVTKACFYEPSVNISYEELAKYHQTAVIPTRVAKPRDKAKVEGSVLIVEREVLAPLRNHTLVGLAGAKEAVWEKLHALNSRPFQELAGSREQLFRDFEKPALTPLPARRYDEGIWKNAKVHLDYHVVVEGHHYSVPFQHIGKKVEVRTTLATVEVFFDQVRVASHRRSFVKGGCTTDEAHMPEKHRRRKGWTPDKILSWAEDVGPDVRAACSAILESRQHPEQGVRACLGVLSLGRKYGTPRLEAACRRAMLIGSPSYQRLRSILENNLDDQPVPESSQRRLGSHENIRGAAYYSENQNPEEHHALATHY
jgi:transposase